MDFSPFNMDIAIHHFFSKKKIKISTDWIVNSADHDKTAHLSLILVCTGCMSKICCPPAYCKLNIKNLNVFLFFFTFIKQNTYNYNDVLGKMILKQKTTAAYGGLCYMSYCQYTNTKSMTWSILIMSSTKSLQ
jgi:hypothetical protein